VNAPISPADFRERFVDADGFRVRYLECGRGEPLVWLHGAGGVRISRSHALLAEDFRVLLFEAPGFGTSAENTRTQSIQELADTMAAAITSAGVERFALMGNSFGGRLALWLAIANPERLNALVLAAPAALRPAGGNLPPASPQDRLGMLYAHPERQPPMPPLTPEIVAKQEALVSRLRGRAHDPALLTAMETLDVPVLVLFGTLDRVIPSEMGRTYRATLPRCNFVLMYDAGHALDADRPEAFAEVVRDFLQRGEGFLVTTASGLIHP
jgi:pimeloyl-ACP methyl ester carboxylesterase